MNKQFVLASGNPGKAREIGEILASTPWQVQLQSDLGVESVPETGSTFVENALIKARHAAKATGLPALGDDSGLEALALAGEPGIYSARYAGPEATDRDNYEKLLTELEPYSDRRARFFCCMVFMRHGNDPAPLIAQAAWEGSILKQPVGEGGFGYDPVFLPNGLEISAAQMESEAKNRDSHRGLALAQMVKLLQSEG